ncbi:MULTISPECIES: hypothetical protein [unclassified Pseudonocardia]|uniref:hypothetical protein n=1 Tax=unclassified Pseudonocardia TaxID=2619320 RepID=UPI0006CB3D8C|nr:MULTISPECIES: hypothetical protein [unclassified Pseudonocardia]ALE75122.1 hypothetical protein FRP1_23350 [Pseudonocardia sp. EC080625-04]ALL74481.1 hypothetical protein AD006_02545 [Pseudonocardia sp. EC080610-09]ALL81501.1 hypothetical protein AD017_10360 [Pseudonocardia sp. EC080619-01]OLM16286.1 putative integral membrane protein [Pseudonocardia sp. Ae707_Ps1]
MAVAMLLGEDVARSERFIAPAVLYVGFLAILFGGAPGPLPEPWAASALLLYPVGAWLAHAVAETEDDTARTVTLSAAGGPLPVAAGVLLAATAGVAALGLVAVVWGVVAAWGTATTGGLLDGLLAHLACGITGAAVGSVFARPLFRSQGVALVAALTVLVVTGTSSWLPPVGTAAASLGNGRGGLGPFGDLLLAVLVAVAALTLVVRVEQGRFASWRDSWSALVERIRPGS